MVALTTRLQYGWGMRGQFSGDHINLEKAVAYWLLRANAAVRTEMYRAFRVLDVEMTPEQWVVLVRLWSQDGLSQTQLCDLTHKDKTTMSRILALMQKRGWVVRKALPEDLRQYQVRLTPKGRGLEKSAASVARSMVARLEAGFSEMELLALRKSLQLLVKNLETAGTD